MKKILIINNNMEMGGIQKSLLNMLKTIYDQYDITLLLFYRNGALLKDIPTNINIITPNAIYKTLGMNKKQLLFHPGLAFCKLIFKMTSKLFGRRKTMKYLGIFQSKIKGFDVAISYSHIINDKVFENGTAEFVLDKIICKNKICMIHCDYQKSGYCSENNNREYKEFNKIVCCSNSVRTAFINQSSIDEKKVFTLRNFYDLDVLNLAKINPYKYSDKYINLLTVARLSSEKGIDSFIKAIYDSCRNNIRYYIIGDGPQKEYLLSIIKKYNMKDKVFLLGEMDNPYRYMINSDYLVLPSIHEAAPIVFDEANLLNVPIISTETLSAKEMVTNGIIDNDLKRIINKLNKRLKNEHINNKLDNNDRLLSFKRIIGR